MKGADPAASVLNSVDHNVKTSRNSMAELAGGARFPAKLLRSLHPFQNDPEKFRRAGIQYTLEQCHDLLANGVAGIHFYTLNRSDATRTIFDSLGITRHRNLHASGV